MRLIKKGATSQSVYFSILDSASTTGGKKTGIAFNTASLTAYYTLNGAAAVAITLATLATAATAWSSGGFVEVSSANAPGLYRLDVPNAGLTGADSCVVSLKGAAGMVQVDIEIQLTGIDIMDAVRGGMTAMPNAAAEAAGGLYTRGSGAGQINQDANGRVDANTKAWIGGAIPAVNVTGVPLVDDKYLLGTIYSTPATSGIMDVNTKNINNVAAATPGATGGLFIAGTNAATSITTALTANVIGNITGNLSGSAGSVTARVTANADQLAGQTITAASGVTFPTSVASPTNITAGTLTTVTNLTNAPTAGDLTATMKTSVTTAATAATPTAAAVTGAVGSVTAGVTVTANNDKTGYRLSATGVADILTTALTEAYAADGVAPTLSQILFLIQSALTEFSIASTTITTKKMDKSTTAATYTLDSATVPTSRTRAT